MQKVQPHEADIRQGHRHEGKLKLLASQAGPAVSPRPPQGYVGCASPSVLLPACRAEPQGDRW